MVAAILGGLAVILSTLLARVLIGSALALVVYTGVSGFVDSVILEFEAQVGNMPATALAIMARAGFGVVVDVTISVLIGVATISMVGKVAGVKKS